MDILQTDLRFYKKGYENASYIPWKAARECTQTLELFQDNVSMARTINGELANTGHKPIKKYKSVITCEDNHPIAFEGIWKWDIVCVECVQRLVTAEVKKGGSVVLERRPVKGSVFLCTEGEIFQLKDPQQGFQVKLDQSEGPGFISYRPILEMIVIDVEMKTDEQKCTTISKISLEEI
ncbi:hypothetical protein [Candidatus Hydrogenosomobacter endosymbioticus]|uniref:Uncharacterized protein n=1 Tax=Candidatus Hydrogenosomobacter endosymbioticus TaxID=2558174 RepID=A0ABM7V8X8_9PROT|nr:hypothetical protein [Candidatus Hydrogenosomobacter endosymbioticus]BDB95916.1 hypothetical protein HYD_0490 [Candidatus Hydrogenosomobacter endosymbioticus]